MTTHTMKSWPHFFQAIKMGFKKHDLRIKEKERDFKIGDTVILLEYDPFKGAYTGQSLTAKITYITSNDLPCAYSSAMLARDAVILSLEVLND